jgi:hypothetical protein
MQGTQATVEDVPKPEAGTHSVAGTLGASRDAFNEILRLLVPVSEADLFGQGRFDWAYGRTLAEVVADCTSKYYLEHDGPIRSWLSQPVVQAV